LEIACGGTRLDARIGELRNKNFHRMVDKRRHKRH